MDNADIKSRIKARIINTLSAFDFSVNQLARIEEILNE